MIVAVDPGVHGAWCRYEPRLDSLAVHDMPTFERKIAGAKTPRAFLDVAALAEQFLLIDLRQGAPRQTTLVIERVGGIPGQSAHASFVFGEGYGSIVTIALMLRWRIERIAPGTWKSALRVPREKSAARARACELLPAYAYQWPLKKHDGRAEASLLALYAEKVLDLS